MFKAKVSLQLAVFPIVQTGSPGALVIQEKTERFHQMQMHTGACTQTSDVSGVGRDLRCYEYQMEMDHGIDTFMLEKLDCNLKPDHGIYHANLYSDQVVDDFDGLFVVPAIIQFGRKKDQAQGAGSGSLGIEIHGGG